MLYFSRGSLGSSFDVAVCPEAAAIDASETSKIGRRLADIVEDLIKCEVVGELRVKAHAIPDFRFVIPNRRTGRASLTRNSNPVENYLRLLTTRLNPENSRRARVERFLV
jgi:hypothetical protein